MDELSATWLAGFLPPVSPCSILPLGTKTRWWQFYLQPYLGKRIPNLTCALPFQKGLKPKPSNEGKTTTCLASPWAEKKKKHLRFLLEELPVFTATSSVRLSKDERQARVFGIKSWELVELENFNGCSKYLCIHLG